MKIDRQFWRVQANGLHIDSKQAPKSTSMPAQRCCAIIVATVALMGFDQTLRAEVLVQGERIVWHPLMLDFAGQMASETDNDSNPFLDYRLQVEFQSPSGKTYNVPGYFDGNGRGGLRGSVWRVRFTPDEDGRLTGQAIDVLEKSGQWDNTIVIFMSDHGPTFQHGKMTLYDLGLRVPLIIRGPGIASGAKCKELVSELDLLPTILELCGIGQGFDYPLHGKSIKGLLTGDKAAKGHEYIFAEISNRGPLPNNGMQERSVFDGRWKLIYREKVETAWRQVNADSRQFKVWGNRTYAETIRLKDSFPRQYQILAEMDPQNLGGAVATVELYDLQSDSDEMQNLAMVAEH